MIYTDRELRDILPFIDWDQPVLIETSEAFGYACRYCIAKLSLLDKDVGSLPQTEEECRVHLVEVHGRKVH